MTVVVPLMEVKFDMVKVDSLKFLHETIGLIKGINCFRDDIRKSVFGNEYLHNHRSEGKEHNRYPVVQYRQTNGYATLWGIGLFGVQSIEQVLDSPYLAEKYLLSRTILRKELVEVAFTQDNQKLTYLASDILPIGSGEEKRWKNLETLSQKVKMLEEILYGNLVSFGWGVGLNPRFGQIKVELVDFDIQGKISDLKSNPKEDFSLLKFRIKYKTNLILPDGIALGKSKARGYGIQYCIS